MIHSTLWSTFFTLIAGLGNWTDRRLLWNYWFSDWPQICSERWQRIRLEFTLRHNDFHITDDVQRSSSVSDAICLGKVIIHFCRTEFMIIIEWIGSLSPMIELGVASPIKPYLTRFHGEEFTNAAWWKWTKRLNTSADDGSTVFRLEIERVCERERETAKRAGITL